MIFKRNKYYFQVIYLIISDNKFFAKKYILSSNQKIQKENLIFV